jgi:hypothetical protein
MQGSIQAMTASFQVLQFLIYQTPYHLMLYNFKYWCCR